MAVFVARVDTPISLAKNKMDDHFGLLNR